ncbi:MAG: ATP-dependent zinc metalloprotease FtsH [Bacteroidales bacterium]|nr:ATP-dependent zinc metalloprotease FtsH [Bacteroidales bacterium]
MENDIKKVEKDINKSATKSSNNKNRIPNPLKGAGQSGNNKGFNFYWVYGIIAAIFILLNVFSSQTPTDNLIQKGKLITMLRTGDVEKIIVVNKDEYAEVYVKSDKLESYPSLKPSDSPFGMRAAHFVYNGDLESFGETIQKVQEENDVFEVDRVYIEHENRVDYTSQILSWLLPLGLIILFWVFIMRKMGGGAGGAGGQIFNIGKSKAQLFDSNLKQKITFNDVAGLAEAKVEVMEIVDFLKKPEKYTELGGKIPKGALLIGPPGTGKTLIAKAVAGEAEVPFFSIAGSDFVEMFVGVGASRVRDLFKTAKEKAPCIIFIDEIDAIGRARGKNQMQGGNDERENTLNQLLTEMDGFSNNQGVIILAATNRADVLDKALLRAGRFDRQIQVELPDLVEREAIFKVHAKPLKTRKDLDLSSLAKQTPGFAGADIANVCNEAALIAARSNAKDIGKQDFMDAIDRIIGGLEKRNKIISPIEKSTIAHHEAGHASVSWLLEHANPLVKVTIIPRGKALGAAWYLPEERQITTFEQMFDEMTSAMGGRAAEQVIFGKVSTGALNDLEKVTKQAQAMVAYYGLNDKVGNISYYDSSGQSEYSFQRPYSEKTAELIDKEVHDLAEKAYKRAVEILTNNTDKLKQLAEKLLIDEVIFTDDVEAIFGPRKFDDNKAHDVSRTISKDFKEGYADSEKRKKEHLEERKKQQEESIKKADEEEEEQRIQKENNEEIKAK